MSNSPAIDWESLTTEYGEVLVSELQTSFESHESASWNPESLSNQLGVDLDLVRSLLRKLATTGELDATTSNRCSVCDIELTEENMEENCPEDLDGGDHKGEEILTFRRKGVRGADLGWVMTIHGMNSRGPWQERFSWRLARIYRHSVPVAIYKYGHILITPLIGWRQQTYVEHLLVEIRSRQVEARELGYTALPTVIAHSFGTWLLARVLEKSCSDGGDRIDVGRVILTGSIIRPDFDWGARIKQGQVEAVLCHYSPVDGPVSFAHWGIPDSGPSGRIGFNDVNSVVHKKEVGFGHSDYFETVHADRIWKKVWQPFLRNPVTCHTYRDVGDPIAETKKPWKPSRLRLITHVMKWVLLAMLFTVGASLVVCAGLGAYVLWRLLRG